MTPLISVIVPVYNVEKYLDRCIQSIIDQTYQNLEIILVDDGSTDDSSQKCDEWEKKDNRIVVIHKSNGGLSDARNIGIIHAKGEYIGFIDSDDCVNHNMYQALYDILLKTKADIAECKCVSFHDEKEISLEKDPDSSGLICYKLFSPEEALLELILGRNLKQTVWNKLYKKKCINTFFPVGKINEDEFWTYRIFGGANRIVAVDDALYYYFQRDSSIMHSKYSINRLDGVLARKERLYYIERFFPRLYNHASLSFLCACFYHYQVITRNSDIDKKRIQRHNLYIQYSENYNKDAVNLQTFKQRVWMRSFKLLPNITCRVRNLLKVGL